MSFKKVIAGILALCLLMFVSAVLFVDFRLAHSATKTNTSAGTSRAIADGVSPDAVAKTTGRIFLHVEHRVGFNESLAWQLRRALMETGRFQVTLVNNAPEPDDHPLLFVDSDIETYHWYVFGGSCAAKVRFGFATDTSAIDSEQHGSIELKPESIPERIQVRVYGTVDVVDRTVGLVSRTSYRKELTTDPAKQIVKAVTEALEATEKEIRDKQSK